MGHLSGNPVDVIFCQLQEENKEALLTITGLSGDRLATFISDIEIAISKAKAAFDKGLTTRKSVAKAIHKAEQAAADVQEAVQGLREALQDIPFTGCQYFAERSWSELLDMAEEIEIHAGRAAYQVQSHLHGAGRDSGSVLEMLAADIAGAFTKADLQITTSRPNKDYGSGGPYWQTCCLCFELVEHHLADPHPILKQGVKMHKSRLVL